MGVFNKTIIPLALFEYEIVIAKSTISYPTRYRARARGIIVKYIHIYTSCWQGRIGKKSASLVLEKGAADIQRRVTLSVNEKLKTIGEAGPGLVINTSDIMT